MICVSYCFTNTLKTTAYAAFNKYFIINYFNVLLLLLLLLVLLLLLL